MRYYLAPMEGVTGRIFRNAYHAFFCPMDKYFAPFITPNPDGGIGPKDLRDIAPEHNTGIPLIPQILTDQADGFIRTAKTLERMGYREINLNLGCPSGTVVSKGRGSGFLAYPKELDQFLYQIFSAFSQSDLKISVKTRLGKEREEEFEGLLPIFDQYPMEELIIHPRVREDYYKNPPRMEAFSKAFLQSANPVCYNGDIYTPSDLKRLTDRHPSLDRVMLGRGIVTDPGLLEQIKTGIPITKERSQGFHDHLYHSFRDFFLPISGEHVVLYKMKEYWSYMIAMFPDSKKYRKKIERSQTLIAYEAAVLSLFNECPFVVRP